MIPSDIEVFTFATRVLTHLHTLGPISPRSLFRELDIQSSTPEEGVAQGAVVSDLICLNYITTTLSGSGELTLSALQSWDSEQMGLDLRELKELKEIQNTHRTKLPVSNSAFGRTAAKSKRVQGINPKDIIGATKVPLGLVPPVFIANTAMALMEGAGKYGPFNWRRTSSPVQMMIYLEAAMGHIQALIDGQDIDVDSGLHHVAKAAACCAIILDATACNNMIDNRPSIWPNRARGTFSRDPSTLFGDKDRIKEILKKPWVTYPEEGEPEGLGSVDLTK